MLASSFHHVVGGFFNVYVENLGRFASNCYN